MRRLLKLFPVFLFSCLTVSCDFDNFFVLTDYVDVDVAPQLEITVIDTAGLVLDSASVLLFDSKENFLSMSDTIQFMLAGEDGKALFKDLDEIIYYFYAERGELNNYSEVVTFVDSLKINEILTITTIIR